MKIVVIVLGLSCLSFLKNENAGSYRRIKDPCRAVLDSTAVIVEYGEFTTRWQQGYPDYNKCTKASIWLEHRPFKELKCLLNSSDPLYRLYGYMNAGAQHLDSLDTSYSFLLDDTTSLQVITPNGIQDLHLTIGEFLKKIHEEFIRENVDWAKRPVLESKVKDFIKQYAKYPSSYHPISFPFFSIGGETGQRLTDFRLRHIYQIENNKRQLVKVMSEFVFTPGFDINVIARDSSTAIRSYPPKLSEWLSEFGRKLNQKDSIDLKLK